jgi:cyclopropane fatty-acyl-phospholipid synthase-like methyltransferase
MMEYRLAGSKSVTILLLLFMGTACVQAQKVPDKLNKSFLDPEMNVSRFENMFEAESREVFYGRHQVTAAMDLKPGEAVADIGAGTGFYMSLFAEKVGSEGHTYAVEVSPRFVEHLRKRADEEKLDNVTVVYSSLDSATLPPESVDVIFMCDTYHHFGQPAEMMASIVRAMRPGARFYIIDFIRNENSSQWTKDHVRAGEEVFRKEIEDAGLTFDGKIDLEVLKENYMLRFVKR